LAAEQLRKITVANLLTKLKLEELSLVDRPANAEAMVSLFKRDSSIEKESDMTDEEMKAKMKPYMDKGMSEADAKKKVMENMAKAEEDLKVAKAENEKLRKFLLDEGYKITADGVEKKAAEETIEVNGEQVVKSDIPAPVLKALEEAEIAKAEAELKKRAEEVLPNVKEDHAKTLLKMADATDEEFLEFLRAIDDLFEKQMEEVGKTGSDGDMSDPEVALEKMVEGHMKEHKMSKKDYAQAYAAVVKTDEGKALVAKSYKEK
jgi:hypothetical protein